MSNCANTELCADGNCIGCQNGQIWCQDPRCHPYCQGEECLMSSDHDANANIVIIIILLALIMILIIVWFFYGPSFFRYYKTA